MQNYVEEKKELGNKYRENSDKMIETQVFEISSPESGSTKEKINQERKVPSPQP